MKLHVTSWGSGRPPNGIDMLPRTLLRTRRQLHSNGLAIACSSSHCHCNPLLPDLSPRACAVTARCTPGTRRTIKLGQAPSILRKQKQAKAQARVASHERSQQDELEAATLVQLSLDFIIRIKAVSVTKPQLLGFYNAFEDVVEHIRDGKDANLASFRDAQKAHGLRDEDCLAIAQGMSLYRSPLTARTWMYLRHLLSLTGYLPATLWMIGALLESARRDKSKIHSAEARSALEHLRSVAQDSDGDYRAKTLLGRVENLLGNEEKAIKLLTQAMHGMKDTSGSDKAETSPQSPLSLERMYQLDSPYIDLARIHSVRIQRGRPENDACLLALNTGCDCDDPTSYYDRAVYFQNVDASGIYSSDSTWLYDMTKAAASGHPKAMFELSKYYAQRGPESIEDEQPTHVELTSLDASRPAQTSLANQVGQFFGFAQLKSGGTVAGISQSAAFPRSASHRVKLAHDWGLLAIDKGYAPATLHLAKLHLAKSLFPAVEGGKRHTSASKADNEAVQNAIDSTAARHEGNAQATPNAQYDPAAAQKFLQMFFYAERALALRKALQESNIKLPHGRGPPQQDDQTSTGDREAQYFAEQPPEVRRWWMNRQVLEIYEDEMAQLAAEARQICDANGFIIYDSDGALMYRCKSVLPEKPIVKYGKAALSRG